MLFVLVLLRLWHRALGGCGCGCVWGGVNSRGRALRFGAQSPPHARASGLFAGRRRGLLRRPRDRRVQVGPLTPLGRVASLLVLPF